MAECACEKCLCMVEVGPSENVCNDCLVLHGEDAEEFTGTDSGAK